MCRIRKHEKRCRYTSTCSSAREGKNQKKITVVKATNKNCSLISDHFGSLEQPENRVQIGNEVYPLKNNVSIGPVAPSSHSDYSRSQRFKFEMSFSNDHLLKPWADFAETSCVSVDEQMATDLKFYSQQLHTGKVSLEAGKTAIERIKSYNWVIAQTPVS